MQLRRALRRLYAALEVMEDGHDTGMSTFYLSTELCLVTPRDAADLEMGLSCGYASFEDGRPYERGAHQWTRFAVATLSAPASDPSFEMS